MMFPICCEAQAFAASAEVQRERRIRKPAAAACCESHLCPAPTKQAIDPKLIEQIDVRVGMIEVVGEIEGSDKLMALQVQLRRPRPYRRWRGSDRSARTRSRLRAARPLFVVNLPPRKMKGMYH